MCARRSRPLTYRLGIIQCVCVCVCVLNHTTKREKHPFIDKQSQIAERKTVGEQGPGDRSKEAAEQKRPGPTPLTGQKREKREKNPFNDKQSQ
jgi:hypothetical protein